MSTNYKSVPDRSHTCLPDKRGNCRDCVREDREARRRSDKAWEALQKLVEAGKS